ncbi:MAG: M67 family metallopeptidase [Singulisphaera sp.]|nr:M67 family metallopeptidase [Singulisphaera sp.]
MSDHRDPLTIPASIFEAMVGHARREAPLECCGILGGVAPRVSSFHPLRNVEESPVRFEANPRDLIDTVLALRARRADIVAIYHSHPRAEPVPSQTDLARNYHGDTPQIIISLLRRTPEVRAWRLAPDSFDELRWQVVADAEIGEAIDLGA